MQVPTSQEIRERLPVSRRVRLLVAAGLVAAGALASLAWLTPDCPAGRCPEISELESYRPPEPPLVYARDGSLAGQLPGPRRIVVPLERVPWTLRKGFIAVEDRRFREHPGVDPWGVGRSFIRNLRAGAVVEGASTITMQLARNIFASEVLDYSRWRRKATEVRLALALESRLTKDEILQIYLNQIYLGDGVYGVGAAARSYFDKPVPALTLPEAALLIGLVKNPEGYNPRRHPERALERRNVVLDVMAREGVVAEARAQRAARAPLDLAERPPLWDDGSYYAAAVRRELVRILPDPRSREGVRVHTGLDPALQARAEEELRRQIGHIEEGRYGPYRHPVPPDAGGAGRPGASPYLQGMVVSLDAASGEVRALVGGRDFTETEFDRAFLARRQPGSAFKPVVLSAALSSRIPLSSLVRVDSLSVPISERPEDSLWHLADVDVLTGSDERSTLNVRDALVRSSNVAAVRLGSRVGIDAVVRRARELGIGTPIPHYPALFLGTAEVVPAQLVAAYAAFENGGYRVEPHLIRSVEAPDGRLLWRAPPPTPEPVLDPAVAHLVRSVLQDVVDEGTGWRARTGGLEGPAAGKTGTTDEGRDVWFVGMRPGMVTGVWLGFDRPRSILPGASGGRLAAPVWGRIMASRTASEDAAGGRLDRRDPWRAPPELTRARVDGSTGFLADDGCPEKDVRSELFLPGTEPRETCPIHGRTFLERIVREIRGLFGDEHDPPRRRLRAESPR